MKHETVEKHEVYKNENVGGISAGGFLIIMGAIFFFGMTGEDILGFNPWIFMTLLPVYWIAVTAYKCYKEEGRLTFQVFSIIEVLQLVAKGASNNVHNPTSSVYAMLAFC